MRNGLAIGAVLASVVLAGCGSASTGAPKPGEPGPGQPAPTQAKSARTAPAKSAEIADKCSIVTEQQWRELGADQQPKQRESNGRLGCQYQKGAAGTPGWGMFVAVDNRSTYGELLASGGDTGGQPTKTGEIAGYPTASFTSDIGCVLLADVSDKGYLIVNGGKLSTVDPGVDLCQQAEKVAQAAVQNLPNA